MIDLIAVRHGETDWNRVRRLQGQTDVPLNALGVEQAARLGRALAAEPIVAIHASDLLRAATTAEPAAERLGLSIRRDPRLRERHYGVLEGRTFPEFLASHPHEAERLRVRDAHHTIEGGESQQTFFDRVVAAVTEIAADADRTVARGDGQRPAILIVTHGGVLDMLHRAATGLALDAERIAPIPNAVINRLVFDDGAFVVRGWAEAP